MKKIAPFLKNRIPLFIFLACYLIFALITYKHYGITVDERDVYLRGKLFYTKVRGDDKVLQKDFVIKEETRENDMLFYNNAYAAGLYMLNDSESYEIYHLENLFFASLIFIVLYEIILRSIKSKWLALMSIIFLAFTPRFFGDIPSNPKDIPFAIFYFLSLALIFLSLKWEEKLRIIILGISFGITQGNRIIGYSIYPVFLIFRLILLIQEARSNNKDILKKIATFLLEIFIIFLIGYLVHIFTLPYLGADPFNHFLQIIKISKSYPWAGTYLMFGKSFFAQKPQIFYLPVWVFITTPLFILILASFLSYKQYKNRVFTLFFISFVVNFVIYFMVRPVLYDGLRHMVFLIPQIVVLSIFGFKTILESKNPILKNLGIVLISTNIFLVGVQYIKLHPYEYVYFNEVVGGLKGARGEFETDYWGASYKEAANWIIDHATREQPYVIGTCGNQEAVISAFNLKNVEAHIEGISDFSSNKYDYMICWERFNENKKVQGKIIYTVSREGVPLTYVYEIAKK